MTIAKYYDSVQIEASVLPKILTFTRVNPTKITT